METFIIVLCWILFGVACGTVAKSKNRNIALWSILGFLFGFIPLIIVALLPPVENKEIL